MHVRSIESYGSVVSDTEFYRPLRPAKCKVFIVPIYTPLFALGLIAPCIVILMHQHSIVVIEHDTMYHMGYRFGQHLHLDCTE